MLADGARETLIGDLRSPRDKMIVTWLGDGGFRVGELCGLHLIDLHLREKADCGECLTPHVHICHRELNPNKSRAKAKHPWVIENGVLRGGQIRRASPAMVHAYFEYLTTEYPADAAHGMLLVQLKGPQRGEPLSTAGVRQMMGRAGRRLGLGRTNPHAMRHGFANAVLDASNGNIVFARDAGGWASATTVEETYGHADLHDPAFMAALDRVWGES
jgi:integrase